MSEFTQERKKMTYKGSFNHKAQNLTGINLSHVIQLSNFKDLLIVPKMLGFNTCPIKKLLFKNDKNVYNSYRS